MGGKTGTTTQSVQIPPDVLARYNAVNTRAEGVAATPFQPYTGQFVAGITPTQQAGINATTQYAQAAQPYYQAATQQLGQAQGQGQQAIQQAFGSLGQGVDVGQQYAQGATRGIGAALDYAQPYQQGATQAAMAGATQLTPENINIQGYMNPYTQAVAQTTQQALNQQQQEQMAGQLGNAIRSGAFGGDRAALAAANLGRQQQLGMAQAMAPIYQQGYSQALGTATSMAQANRSALQNLSQQLQGIGQQGYGQQMGAAQQLANLGQQQFAQGLGAAGQYGALGQQQYGMGAGTAQQLAALGTGAQQAALQGAQAQLGAGTLEQQTQQADLTARYQQFLQERGYPFQVAQFLANIAMGTGALSGQTTTTTQPMPFFSDRRVKDDVKEIGKTHDGQPIYSFKYKGDDATRIGLMAQDVEKKHPEAVYDMGGVKGVDYKQATENAERPEKYHGGLVPASMGGAVTEPGAYNRGGYSPGGLVDPNDIQALLAQQQSAFGPFGEGGIYGASHHEAPFAGAKGIVPQARLHVPKMMQPGAAPKMPEGMGAQAIEAFDQAMAMKGRYDTAKEAAKDLFGGKKTPQTEMDEKRKDLTTQEETKGLAGPDIKAPSSKEEQGWIDWIREKTGLADGGIVPRHGYKLEGFVNPYEKAEEYFPEKSLEESEKEDELKKPGQTPQSTSQTGLSLGDAVSLGKTLFSIASLSDRRAKHDVKEIGKTHDGLPIYSYKMNGGDKTQIGLMAQDVEKHNPDAVYNIGGLKHLNYKMATKNSERNGHYDGGLVPRRGYQTAGLVVGEEPESGQIIEGGVAGQKLPPVPLVRSVKNQDVAVPKETPDANFARSLSRTLQFEGPKAVIDNDGKLRRYGITPEEAGVPVDEITPSTAAPAYYNNYWKASGADKLDPNLAMVHFDTAVNSGVGRAKKLLEASGGDPNKYLDAREQFLRNLAENDTQGKYRPYLSGWMNRIAQLRSDISSDAGSYRNLRSDTPTGGVVPQNVGMAASAPETEGGGLTGGIMNYLKENQSWLSPLGAGLRGMVQSKSPFFGGALLEGIGTGLEAVTPTQKALADIGQIRSTTAETIASIPNNAIVTDKYGRTIGVKVYRGSSLTPEIVSIDEFMKARRENRPYRVAPTIDGGITTPEIQAPDLGVNQPKLEEGPVTGTTAPRVEAEKPTEEAERGVPIYRELPSDIKTIVEQNASQVLNTGIEGMNPQETNPFNEQDVAARASQRDLTQRNALTVALADLPRSGSMISPNKFSAQISTPLVQYINGFLTNLNTGVTISNPADLGNVDVIDKISRVLALKRTDEAGQRANAALVETLKAIPTNANTPEGAAQLIADLYVMQQRDIDLDRFYKQSRAYAEQNMGINSRESQFIGRGLADEFSKKMESKYADEKKQIAKLYTMKVKVRNPATGQIEKPYAISLIAKNGGIVPEGLRNAILEQGIDPEIFRYFSSQ